MTDFHWITLGLAVGVVAVVWAFNFWQEWRFRRRAAAAFAKNHPDVLLDTPKNMVRQGETGMRLEPSISPAGRAMGESMPAEPELLDMAESVALAAAILDPLLDYIAEVHPGDVIVAEEIPSFDFGKRVRIVGLAESDEWEVARHGGRYTELRVGLQLVDRQGPASEAQLVMFCEAVNAFAEKHGGVATFPRRDDKLRAAVKLDKFCADVDVVIGLNVIVETSHYPVTRIISLAKGAGMVLEVDGALHAKSESGKTVFTLIDRHHRPLDALEETPSITLLLDLPRVAGGEQAFDRMADLAQQIVLTMGGDLVDDDNRSLKPVDLATIRSQLAAVSSQMDDHGIPAGGVAALRLFS